MLRIPKYCLHRDRGSGLAYSTVDGREKYWGRHGSPESYERYDEFVLEYRQEHDALGKHSLTVGQLCLLFMRHAANHYRHPDGTSTGEADNFRQALKPLCEMFRGIAAARFGPLKLEHVRNRLIERGFVRTSINRSIHRIRHVFKWGLARELVPPETYTALIALASLKPGRSQAVESEPVVPVPEGHIDAI